MGCEIGFGTLFNSSMISAGVSRSRCFFGSEAIQRSRRSSRRSFLGTAGAACVVGPISLMTLHLSERFGLTPDPADSQ
jgi:hypothetical protein